MYSSFQNTVQHIDHTVNYSYLVAFDNDWNEDFIKPLIFLFYRGQVLGKLKSWSMLKCWLDVDGLKCAKWTAMNDDGAFKVDGPGWTVQRKVGDIGLKWTILWWKVGGPANSEPLEVRERTFGSMILYPLSAVTLEQSKPLLWSYIHPKVYLVVNAI